MYNINVVMRCYSILLYNIYVVKRCYVLVLYNSIVVTSCYRVLLYNIYVVIVQPYKLKAQRSKRRAAVARLKLLLITAGHVHNL